MERMAQTMKLKLYCVGVDAPLSGSFYKSWLDVMGSIGMKLTSGIILIVKTKMFERTFVVSDPMAINRKDTGFRATMMMMKDFEVSDPPKNVLIANMNGNLADVEVIGRTAKLDDVKIRFVMN
jgi:hypothetical protein